MITSVVESLMFQKIVQSIVGHIHRDMDLDWL